MGETLADGGDPGALLGALARYPAAILLGTGLGGIMGVHTDMSSGQRGYVGPALHQPFEMEIERTLKPLWGMRERASLFSIAIGSLGQERTLSLVRRALAHAGPVGSLRDGGAGLLYVGPRERGCGGDRRLERWVADVMGWTVFYLTESCTGADVDVVGVHRWLDEISSPDELVGPLMRSCTVGAAQRLTVG